MSNIVVENIEKIEFKHKSEHENYEYNKCEITPRKDFNQAYVCVYEIMPLKSVYPKHYHSCNTECIFIVSGKGMIKTKDEEFNIFSGDIIVFPPGPEGTHKLTNVSSENKLLYIDFDTTNSPDIIHYPDSNKFGIIQHNVSSNFYKEDKKIDYYDGE